MLASSQAGGMRREGLSPCFIGAEPKLGQMLAPKACLHSQEPRADLAPASVNTITQARATPLALQTWLSMQSFQFSISAKK